MKRYIKSDVDVTLSPEEMNNPDSISIKNIISRRQKAKDEKEAAEAAEAKRQGFLKKYAGLIDEVEEASTTEDKLNVLFDKLVPAEGNADTLAGELVRAMMRVMYRYLNDGDYFYDGYGLETAGSSAKFVADHIPATEDKFIHLAEEGADDDDYEGGLYDIAQIVIDYIVSEHPELIAEPNTDDCNDLDGDFWKEYAPSYEYDVEVPYDVQDHIDAEHVSWEDVAEQVEDWVTSEFGSDVYLNQWARDAWTVEGLSKEQYKELESVFDSWMEQYANDLIDEYGDPNEEDEEEEEEEE